MDAKLLERIFVDPNATLRETIAHIDAGRAQLALVVDADRRLIGTVTDGDVRRALLHGVELDHAVEGIVRRDPICVPAGTGDDELLELMTDHRIEQVPILDDGRVLDVVLLRDLVQPHDHPVVIVAGGEGKRLRPLTDDVPKPMLHVGGKPLLETTIEQVRDAGFSKVFLSVNYRAEAIEEHFGTGKEFGVEIEYVREDVPLGSAGSLQLMRERLQQPFVVMNGDVLTNVDFDALMRSHRGEGNAVTICVKQYVLQVPYGVIDLDGTEVVGLREKPELKFLVNAGIYALSPEAVDLVPNEPREFHMTELIDAALASNARVGSFAVREYWLDVGQFADYERANEEHGLLVFKADER
jgi:dTDP-glucose pyrophosphorylase